ELTVLAGRPVQSCLKDPVAGTVVPGAGWDDPDQVALDADGSFPRRPMFPGLGSAGMTEVESASVRMPRRQYWQMAKPIDWHRLLIDGYDPLKKGQRIFGRLPSDPRCKLCRNPFGGVGGKLFRVIGRKPSRKNRNLCQYCFDHLPPGGIEIDIGVLFA